MNFNLIADAAGETGLGFDIGVLDESGFEFTLGGEIRLPQRLVDIAAHDSSAHQNVFFAVGMNQCSARRESRIDVKNRRLLVPYNRKIDHIRDSTAVVLPTTAAIASPRKRASFSAKTGWSANCGFTL